MWFWPAVVPWGRQSQVLRLPLLLPNCWRPDVRVLDLIRISIYTFYTINIKKKESFSKGLGVFLTALALPSVPQDPHPAVRARAANALAEMGDTQAPKDLRIPNSQCLWPQ